MTRTHGHEIHCSTPFPIDPSKLTEGQKAMSLAERIRFFNGDAHDVLANGSAVLFQGRGDTHPQMKHTTVLKVPPLHLLFADTPFGWFTGVYHDIPWSKAYWERLCVAAHKALLEDGAFVIRYGGWRLQIFTRRS